MEVGGEEARGKMSATGEFQCRKCFHVGTQAEFTKKCPRCGSMHEPLDLDKFQHPDRMRDPGEGKPVPRKSKEERQ